MVGKGESALTQIRAVAPDCTSCVFILHHHTVSMTLHSVWWYGKPASWSTSVINDSMLSWRMHAIVWIRTLFYFIFWIRTLFWNTVFTWRNDWQTNRGCSNTGIWLTLFSKVNKVENTNVKENKWYFANVKIWALPIKISVKNSEIEAKIESLILCPSPSLIASQHLDFMRSVLLYINMYIFVIA